MKQLRAIWMATTVALTLLALGAPAAAQTARADAEGMVTLDFADVELAAVIETIAKMTGQNFIYDDRVRGRVTIVSPTPMPVDQAYAVFESVLQVKGFTTVKTPGGAIKVVPVREAKESSVETVISSRPPPNRDRFVTRLIPLNYIDAESIVNTLKPLVSKDASMAAYAPTNTVILTESSSNIRRIIAVLESIDVETYKEELAVINVDHADAATLADQVSEIYGAEVSSSTTPAAARRATRRRANQAEAATPSAGKRKPVRILTDERTNSLLVLAARPQLEEVRRLIAKLDVPVVGGGRIHVLTLKNANAEEMAQTLGGLLGSGGSRAVPTPTGSGNAGAPPAIRSAVASLAGGISVTADPATNALIIQASKEGFETLSRVIEQLDVERPQVLVEALIIEVDVTDGRDLGFAAIYRTINGDSDFIFQTATESTAAALSGGASALLPAGGDAALQPFIGRFIRDQLEFDDGTDAPPTGGSIIDGVIRLSATNADIDIVSAPHILTSDNEQAEIRVGDNIPIISSRVESAAGISSDGLSSSVNVERQDIGVTLRVTPQITEGDTMRLEIFQEITAINPGLVAATGNPADVGVPLSNRRIENTVVVGDGETVVIGGLISDQTSENIVKVPYLGDIPILGWLFKSSTTSTEKKNLLVFLTPRIVRSPLDLERETIRKREDFQRSTGGDLAFAEDELELEQQRYAEAVAGGVPYHAADEGHELRSRVAAHTARYPLARMREIEQTQLAEFERLEAERLASDRPPSYWIQAAILSDADAATALLTDLIDSGHDGTLVSQQTGGGVVYQLQLGPFASFAEADAISNVVERSHGLTPTVLLRQASEDGLEGPGESP